MQSRCSAPELRKAQGERNRQLALISRASVLQCVGMRIQSDAERVCGVRQQECQQVDAQEDGVMAALQDAGAGNDADRQHRQEAAPLRTRPRRSSVGWSTSAARNQAS